MSHTNNLLTHPYDISTVAMSYGWLTYSFVWHRYTVVMSYRWFTKFSVWDSEICLKKSSVLYNFDIISCGRVTDSSVLDSMCLEIYKVALLCRRTVMMPSLSSLFPLQVVVMTSYGATIYDKVGILSHFSVLHRNTISLVSQFYFVHIFADRVKLDVPVRSISEENGVITVETEDRQVFKVWLTTDQHLYTPLCFALLCYGYFNC